MSGQPVGVGAPFEMRTIAGRRLGSSSIAAPHHGPDVPRVSHSPVKVRPRGCSNRAPRSRAANCAAAAAGEETCVTSRRATRQDGRQTRRLRPASRLRRSASGKRHRMPMKLWPGLPYPLGATYDGGGTNFAIFSEAAERVQLCLFDDDGRETAMDLPEREALVWQGYLPRVGPGQRYGFRVHGPYDPHAGLRCNPHKLLLDPYAKAIDGRIEWNEALFSYRFGDPLSFNDDDSAPYAAKSVVINPFFDWGNDTPLRIPFHQTVI